MADCCCRCGIAHGYSVDGFILLQWSLPYVEAVKAICACRLPCQLSLPDCRSHSVFGSCKDCRFYPAKLLPLHRTSRAGVRTAFPGFSYLQSRNHPCFIVGSSALFGQRKRAIPLHNSTIYFHYGTTNFNKTSQEPYGYRKRHGEARMLPHRRSRPR